MSHKTNAHMMLLKRAVSLVLISQLAFPPSLLMAMDTGKDDGNSPPTLPAAVSSSSSSLLDVIKQQLPGIPILHQGIKFCVGAEGRKEELGRGAFGTVYKGDWNGKAIALKEINIDKAKISLKSNFTQVSSSAESDSFVQEQETKKRIRIEEIILWEVTNLARANHANVIEFHGMHEDEGNLYMVMPCYEKGDLQKILQSSSPDNKHLIKWAIGITRGLLSLHNTGILHRDLKTDNIFIDDHDRARIGDLGIVATDALIDRDLPKLVTKGVQARGFKAPENVVDWGRSSPEGDIYALGLVFWQMVTRNDKKEVPFTWGWVRKVLTDNIQKFSQAEYQGEILALLLQEDETYDPLKNVSKLLKEKILEILKAEERIAVERPSHPPLADLIQRCCACDPARRPKLKEIEEGLWGIIKKEDTQFHNYLRVCMEMDDIIQTKRADLLTYKFPYLTDYPIQEDMDTFWVRMEKELTKGDDTHSIELTSAASSSTSSSVSPMPAVRPSPSLLPSPLLALHQTFQDFLRDPASSTLLLLGDSGLGKTLSTYQLADRLLAEWRGFLNSTTDASSPARSAPYLPILLRPALSHWSQSVLQGAVEKMIRSTIPGLNPSDCPLLVIVDGYDECQDDISPQNLPQQLGLQNFPRAKLLVTCRPYTVPSSELRARFGVDDQLTTRYFLPFSIPQLLEYAKDGLSWNDATHKHWQQELERSKDLRMVLRNPFVLSLFVQSFETVSKKDPSKLNRFTIYQSFVEHWLNRHQGALSDTVQTSLMGSYQSLPASFNAFAARIAMAAFQQRTVALNKNAVDGGLTELPPWMNLKKTVKDDSLKVFDAKHQSLTEQNKNRTLLTEAQYSAIMLGRLTQFEAGSPLKDRPLLYEFSHKSFLEYFIAQAILQLNPLESTVALTKGLSYLANYLIHKTEPEVLRFIEEGGRAGDTSQLQAMLFQILELSKKDATVSKAASNAATILNILNVPFSGRNLQGIRIPGADLSYAICDYTQFQHANLQNVRFQGAWLRNLSGDGAFMGGVEFGEWPSIICESSVRSCCYSPDGRFLAIGTTNGIDLYDGSNRSKLRTLKGHTGPVNSVVFGPDGLQLASGSGGSGSGDNTVRLWDLTNEGKLVYTFEGHSDAVTSVSFSRDGKKLASGSYDKTVRLWDATSGAHVRTSYPQKLVTWSD